MKQIKISLLFILILINCSFADINKDFENWKMDFKKLALKMAISKKIKDGKFKIISELKISKPKTNLFRSKLSSLKLESVLFIDGKDIDNNFLLAAKNVPKIDILPVAGINVYDILKRDFLVLSENAVNGIKERFEE